VINTRHDTATANELALLLRQHEVVGTSPEKLDKLLGEEINHVQVLNVQLRPSLRAMHHTPARLMERCDEAVTCAHIARTRRSYGEALKWLKEVQRWLSCLRGLAEDASELKLAVSEYEGLLILLGSDYLSRLPSINSVARLLSEADALLATGAQADNLLGARRGRQARFIAALCREKLHELGAPSDGDGTEARRLNAVIDTQSAYCARTSSFAPSPRTDGAMRQAFARLSELLAEVRLTLVARLTSDIEDELSSRRTIFAAIRGYTGLGDDQGAEAAEMPAELKRIIREESWGRAATHLLQQILSSLAGEAGTVRAAALDAAQRLDVALRASELALAEAGTSNN
jgi:hypothetical protein